MPVQILCINKSYKYVHTNTLHQQMLQIFSNITVQQLAEYQPLLKAHCWIVYLWIKVTRPHATWFHLTDPECLKGSMTLGRLWWCLLNALMDTKSLLIIIRSNSFHEQRCLKLAWIWSNLYQAGVIGTWLFLRLGWKLHKIMWKSLVWCNSALFHSALYHRAPGTTWQG